MITKDFLIKTKNWQLTISLLGITVVTTSKNTYKIKDIQQIFCNNQRLGNCTINIVLKTNDQPIISLENFSTTDAQRLIELFLNYTKLLTKLRKLLIEIKQWHLDLVQLASKEFKKSGYLTNYFTNSVLKSIYLKKPKDTDKILSNTNIQEFIAITLSETSYGKAIQAYKITALKFANIFNSYQTNKIINDYSNFFNQIEKSPLTEEQKKAVVNLNNRVLLNASAGSGKTSVMVSKIAYALVFGYFLPQNTVLIAFNNKAVKELKIRVAERLGKLNIPYQDITIKTFHSLAIKIIKEITGTKPPLAKFINEGKDGTNEFIKLYFSIYETNHLLRFYIYFYNQIPSFSIINDNLSPSIQAKKYLTLFLDCCRIKYTCVDATYMTNFNLSIKLKASACINNSKNSIEVSYKDIKTGRALPAILRKLIQNGFSLQSKFHNIKIGHTYSNIDIKRASFFKTFMTHAKNSDISVKELMAKHFGNDLKTSLFLHIYKILAFKWTNYLNGFLDFDDMIIMANHLMTKHNYKSNYHLVMVDECQDISLSRAHLINNLLTNPNDRLFAVGDDWQSINKFAGSTMSIMKNFSSFFGKNDLMKLERTFRCSPSLCKISSKFIQKNKNQLRKTVISQATNYEKALMLFIARGTQYLQKYINFICRSLVFSDEVQKNDKPLSIMILGRYRHEKLYAESALSYSTPHCSIVFSTIHSAKGLEADYIIIPRITNERLGFPCKIVDDSLLDLVSPICDSYPHAEERRLMYVALTRAKRRVIAVSEYPMESEFFLELQTDFHIKPLYVNEIKFYDFHIP